MEGYGQTEATAGITFTFPYETETGEQTSNLCVTLMYILFCLATQNYTYHEHPDLNRSLWRINISLKQSTSNNNL